MKKIILIFLIIALISTTAVSAGVFEFITGDAAKPNFLSRIFGRDTPTKEAPVQVGDQGEEKSAQDEEEPYACDGTSELISLGNIETVAGYEIYVDYIDTVNQYAVLEVDGVLEAFDVGETNTVSDALIKLQFLDASQVALCVQDGCTDSDSGIEPNTFGTTIGKYGIVPGFSSLDDYCLDDDHVVEYYCHDPSNTWTQFMVAQCPGDKECINNECQIPQQQPTCQASLANMDLAQFSKHHAAQYLAPYLIGINFVLDDNGIAAETLVAADIVSSYQAQYPVYNFSATSYLDSELNDCELNTFAIGDICSNTLIRDVLGYTESDCLNPTSVYNDMGIAGMQTYIGLYTTTGNHNITIITGENATGMRYWAEQLVTNQLSGNGNIYY